MFRDVDEKQKKALAPLAALYSKMDDEQRAAFRQKFEAAVTEDEDGLVTVQKKNEYRYATVLFFALTVAVIVLGIILIVT